MKAGSGPMRNARQGISPEEEDENTRIFDENMKIGRIMTDSRFDGFVDKIELVSGIMRTLTHEISFNMLVKLMPAWKNTCILSGINALAKHIDAGIQAHHAIYSDEEVTVDQRKKDTALFWFPAQKKGRFALVLAGGAYTSVASLVEGFPVAAALNERGINAFVLVYRHGKNNLFPAPIEDLHRALTHIITHAGDFEVLQENYAVIGFSAGAHLASEIGTTNCGYKPARVPRPGAIILGYPLVTFEGRGLVMRACIANFLGKPPDPEKKRASFVPERINGDLGLEQHGPGF